MEYYPTSNRVNYGIRIIPIKLIELFSPNQWEEFIEEWLDTKKSKYYDIERLGGSGDMGRDVVAYIDNPKGSNNYRWHCYQCKHYDTPLSPSLILSEFAKIIYYTYKEQYPIPEKYYFVAPKDCGTTLTNLLKKPIELKKRIKNDWQKKCQKSITSSQEIPLEGDLLNYLDNFDFSIFDKIQRKTIIEEHKLHPNHLTRFGGGLPDRPILTDEDVPQKIQNNELNYINNLLKAYNSTDRINVNTTDELKGKYEKHFIKARKGFHFAEQLRVLYRDSLPTNTFEDFQEEIYSGICNTVDKQHNNGFEKVLDVEDKSQQIQITSNPLKDVSKPQDRIGICHQLSNGGKINWDNE